MNRRLLYSFATAFGALAMLFSIAAWFWFQSLHQPLSLERDHVVQVERGASLSRIASRLEAEGTLDNARALVLWARLWGEESIRAGEYRLTPGMSAVELLALLNSGRSIQHPITLVEGWTVAQALDALWASDVIENTLEGLDPEEILQRLESPWPALEGTLFPDTYFVTRGTSDLVLLRRASERMQSVLDTSWLARSVGLPYATPWEALVMASIVERESGHAPERPSVAGVFVRRLQQGMRLQSDPTVIYGIGDAYDGVIRRVDLDTHTAYNTYRISGLPPTPIAMPGRESIEAALQPAMDEPWLYFVSRGDGSHYFSETLQEHNHAVRYYIRGEGEPPDRS